MNTAKIEKLQCILCKYYHLVNSKSSCEIHGTNTGVTDCAFFELKEKTSDVSTGDRIRETFDAVRDLVIAKNTDYGDSAFEPPLMCPELTAGVAIRVRMSDKIRRIIQLENNPAQVKGESLADAYRDIIGYSVLRLIELE